MTDNRRFLNLLIMGKLNDVTFLQLSKGFVPSEDFFDEFLGIQSHKTLSKTVLKKMAGLIVSFAVDHGKIDWISEHIAEMDELDDFHLMLMRRLKKSSKAKEAQELANFYAI